MAKFMAHVDISAISEAQAVGDLLAMSLASSNKTALVQSIETREGG